MTEKRDTDLLTETLAQEEAALLGNLELENSVRRISLTYLGVWGQLADEADGFPAAFRQSMVKRAVGGAGLARLRTIRIGNGTNGSNLGPMSDPSLALANAVIEQIDQTMVQSQSGATSERSETIDAWISSLRDLRVMAYQVRDLLEIKDSTRVAAAKVGNAHRALIEAEEEIASKTAALNDILQKQGQLELSVHFAGVAKKENWYSWGLRALAATIAVGAAVVAFTFAPADARWEAALAHVAGVAALGGLSAYAAQLASAHRETYGWANSVRTQLDSFTNFIGTIQDPATKQRIHEEFARRVLGSPSIAASDGASPLAMSQLVDLILSARGGGPATPPRTE